MRKDAVDAEYDNRQAQDESQKTSVYDMPSQHINQNAPRENRADSAHHSAVRRRVPEHTAGQFDNRGLN